MSDGMNKDRYRHTWRVNTTSNRTQINLLAVILVLRILAILIVFKLFSINHWIVRPSIFPICVSFTRSHLSLDSLSLFLHYVFLSLSFSIISSSLYLSLCYISRSFCWYYHSIHIFVRMIHVQPTTV